MTKLRLPGESMEKRQQLPVLNVKCVTISCLDLHSNYFNLFQVDVDVDAELLLLLLLDLPGVRRRMWQ